ncbi:MAG: hypothetical protein MK212_09065 [Saprospiraceae bacterium]|nr:hypothetical protein [Saprospiraceae bacterium]
MEILRLRNNPILPIITMVCASIIFFLNLLYLGNMMQVCLGAFLFLVGILNLVNPIAVLTDTELQLRNAIGMTLKRYRYKEETVEIREGKLFIGGKKLRFAGWMLRRAEWEALLDHMREVAEDGNAYRHLVD